MPDVVSEPDLPSERPRLIVSADRVPSVRGLALLVNARGAAYARVDVRRWLRVNRCTFKSEKCDIWAPGAHVHRVRDLVECAAELDMRLSIRTDAMEPPPPADELRALGLLDVFLCSAGLTAPYLTPWLEACAAAHIPVRLQIQPPFPPAKDSEEIAKRLSGAGVVSVNVALVDPLLPRAPNLTREGSQATLASMNTLIAALREKEVEANLVGLPFCLAAEENRAHALNSVQFFRDHQQYEEGAYRLALKLHRARPSLAGKALLMLLARATFERSFVDAVLLRIFLRTPLAFMSLSALHKIGRHIGRLRGMPREIVPSIEQQQRVLARARKAERREMGATCARCALRHICDHETPEFRRALPGVQPMAQMAAPGGDGAQKTSDDVISPMHFCAGQPKYYDAMDAARLHRPEALAALARQANDLVTNRPPDRRMMPYEYRVENAPFDHLEGGVRWHSVSNTEKLSSPLGCFEPPFVLSVTFGGGIAEYIGFSFGRRCKVLTPMEAYRHRLDLYVAEDGHFVLLRDGQHVRPAEFEGKVYAPLRLASRLEPRIAAWNIDGHLVTQFVEFRFPAAAVAARPPAKYSVILVNTRYARRLQAALLSLAHQVDFDMERLEIIVCYVPGLDATDDLIDSLALAYPGLRILRAPYPAQNVQSKGFMLNEAAAVASGEWVIMMDADIIVPPTMFASIEAVSDSSQFIAPDGRKMLDRATTARILLGEIEPWRDWDSLLAGAGEYRYREAHGVPVGFFQVCRMALMRQIKYAELEHFEGADMWFGMELIKKVGKETRLSGQPVLHLDHGGSQWYGTQRHF